MLRLGLEIARPPPPAHVGWPWLASLAGKAREDAHAADPRAAVVCLQVVSRRGKVVTEVSIFPDFLVQFTR